MFKSLGAIGIKVTDFEKAFNYYKDTLQLEIHIEDKDTKFAEFVLGNTLLALLSDVTLKDMSENINWENPNDSTFLIAVEVEDLEKTYNILRKKGVKFTQDPKSTPWGQKVAYFKDVEGYLWEVSELEK